MSKAKRLSWGIGFGYSTLFQPFYKNYLNNRKFDFVVQLKIIFFYNFDSFDILFIPLLSI